MDICTAMFISNVFRVYGLLECRVRNTRSWSALFDWLRLYLRSYIGHVKERTVKEQMVRDSTEVLRKAVHRMLPRNKLRDVSSFFELACP